MVSPAHRAIGAALYLNLAAFSIKRVEHQHFSAQTCACTGDKLDRLSRHHGPHHTRQRAQNASLGAGRGKLGRGGLGENALVTRRAICRIKHA